MPRPDPLEPLLSHRAWVRRLARALARDESRALDLEQEVWLRVLVNPPPEPRSPRAWLGTVLRRLAVDQHRKDVRRRRHEGAASSRAPEAEASRVISAREARRHVVAAVRALPEPYRATVLGRFFEERSPTEIARLQAVPVETVRTRLRRGLERLRRRLASAAPAVAPVMSEAGSGGGAIGARAMEVVVMGSKLKIAAVAAVLALLAAGWWSVRSGPLLEAPPPSDGAPDLASPSGRAGGPAAGWRGSAPASRR